MGFKVRHYAANTPGADYKLSIEALILELVFGAIAAAFAIGGWQSGLILLALPCSLVALACFYLVLHSFYLAIRDRVDRRKNTNQVDP